MPEANTTNGKVVDQRAAAATRGKPVPDARSAARPVKLDIRQTQWTTHKARNG